MELKEINISDILANFYQPRTKFEKEGIQELSESILSNGLINPITVRVWKNKYMIVSGERRWRAHKVANIKTIPAFVKEYKDDVAFMIESLIENIHREDLSPTEKGKFCLSIMKKTGITGERELAKLLSVPQESISSWFDVLDIGKKLSSTTHASPTVISETRGLPEKDRITLIKKAVKEDFGGSKMRELVRTIKKSDEPTKKALLSGKVKVEDLREPIPEPVKLEGTANDVVNTILSNLHDFKYNVDILLKEMNIEDLSKLNANKAMTTAGLHIKVFKDFVNALRKRGATPNSLILDLIKANGKI